MSGVIVEVTVACAGAESRARDAGIGMQGAGCDRAERFVTSEGRDGEGASGTTAGLRMRMGSSRDRSAVLDPS